MTTACPRVLAAIPSFIPSTMITVVKPLAQLHRAGRVQARITLESMAAQRDVEWADVVVFCRNAEPKHARLLEAALARRVPVIYDLDDNLFELPPDCDSGQYYLAPARQAMLTDYVRAASLVRVYSRGLAERLAVLNPRVVRSFAPIDLAQIAPIEARSASEVRNRAASLARRASMDRQRPLSIVYATSRAEDVLCDIFLPALARIAHSHAGRVDIHFWGYRPPELAQFPGAALCTGMPIRSLCLRRFSRSRFDIGLAPLCDDAFHRSKTNNKFREYGACGIAGIYSDIEVYSDCVAAGQTGLLVPNDPDRWHEALLQLIEDARLRTTIQRRARAYVEEHYAQEKFEKLFLEQIEGVLSGSTATKTRSAPAFAPAQVPGPNSQRPRLAARWLGRARHLLSYYRQHGVRRTWDALRWAGNDAWMAACLRCGLSSPMTALRQWLGMR